ncbi:MAG: hypothetical protein ACI8ZB_001385 [Desulforhopalus sp.]|jgi:hypothetical protein
MQSMTDIFAGSINTSLLNKSGLFVAAKIVQEPPLSDQCHLSVTGNDQ